MQSFSKHPIYDTTMQTTVNVMYALIQKFKVSFMSCVGFLELQELKHHLLYFQMIEKWLSKMSLLAL